MEAALAWLFQGVPPPGMPLQVEPEPPAKGRGRGQGQGRQPQERKGGPPHLRHTCRLLLASLPVLHCVCAHVTAGQSVRGVGWQGLAGLHAADICSRPTLFDALLYGDPTL